MDTLVTKEFLQQYEQLSTTSFALLQHLFVSEVKPKDVIFIKEGQLNHSEYFVVRGYCRSFLVNPEGEDITLSFYKPGMALSPHIIRTRNDVSLWNMEALTDLELVSFDARAFLQLMIEHLDIRQLGNTILLNELVAKTAKEIAMASLTARERLLQFRTTFHILENLIPHPMIASYLGITNVSLSRLRTELSKG